MLSEKFLQLIMIKKVIFIKSFPSQYLKTNLKKSFTTNNHYKHKQIITINIIQKLIIPTNSRF